MSKPGIFVLVELGVCKERDVEKMLERRNTLAEFKAEKIQSIVTILRARVPGLRNREIQGILEKFPYLPKYHEDRVQSYLDLMGRYDLHPVNHMHGIWGNQSVLEERLAKLAALGMGFSYAFNGKKLFEAAYFKGLHGGVIFKRKAPPDARLKIVPR